MGDGDVSNMVREIKQQRSESHERDENAEKIGSKPEQFWNRPPASEGESILQVTASLLSEGDPLTKHILSGPGSLGCCRSSPIGRCSRLDVTLPSKRECCYAPTAH